MSRKLIWTAIGILYFTSTLQGQSNRDSLLVEINGDSIISLGCPDPPYCSSFSWPLHIKHIQTLASLNHPSDSVRINISDVLIDSMLEISGWNVKSIGFHELNVGLNQNHSGSLFRELSAKEGMYLSNCSFQAKFDLTSCSMPRYLQIYKSKFTSTAEFRYCNIGTAELISNRFCDSLVFTRCSIKFFNLNCVVLPKYLELKECNFDSICFLSGDSVFEDDVCELNIYTCNLNHLLINYKNFRLYFPSAVSAQAQFEFYERLLKKFKENDQHEDFERLDIEYKRKKYSFSGWAGEFFSAVDNIWWKYGYRKSRILLWTLTFFLLFMIVNVFSINYLIHEVYSIGDLKTHIKRYSANKGIRRFRYNIPYAVVYTAYIFLGVKLDVHELRHKRIIPVLYVFLCYVTGLICLAYIVRFVFSF